MAWFLFASPPITGHVVPALSIARELTARGHQLRWYVGEKFRSRVEDAGARFEAYRAGYDYDDSDTDARHSPADARSAGCARSAGTSSRSLSGRPTRSTAICARFSIGTPPT